MTDGVEEETDGVCHKVTGGEFTRDVDVYKRKKKKKKCPCEKQQTSPKTCFKKKKSLGEFIGISHQHVALDAWNGILRGQEVKSRMTFNTEATVYFFSFE